MTELVDQPDAMPTRKVTAYAAGAALATVLLTTAVWLGAEQPPAGLEGALATVLGFIVAYFTRARRREGS
jgi:membrane associated rhomboid family serine protease